MVASDHDEVLALARQVPGAAELVRRTGAPLDVPEEIESASLVELGDLPVTPLDEAMATTVALFGPQRPRRSGAMTRPG